MQRRRLISSSFSATAAAPQPPSLFTILYHDVMIHLCGFLSLEETFAFQRLSSQFHNTLQSTTFQRQFAIAQFPEAKLLPKFQLNTLVELKIENFFQGVEPKKPYIVRSAHPDEPSYLNNPFEGLILPNLKVLRIRVHNIRNFLFFCNPDIYFGLHHLRNLEPYTEAENLAIYKLRDPATIDRRSRFPQLETLDLSGSQLDGDYHCSLPQIGDTFLPRGPFPIVWFFFD